METSTTADKTTRTRFLIHNFVNSDPLEIQAASEQARYRNPIVHITYSNGPLSFQHTLTADQCQDMAHSLIAAARQATLLREAQLAAKSAAQ